MVRLPNTGKVFFLISARRVFTSAQVLQTLVYKRVDGYKWSENSKVRWSRGLSCKDGRSDQTPTERQVIRKDVRKQLRSEESMEIACVNLYSSTQVRFL